MIGLLVIHEELCDVDALSSLSLTLPGACSQVAEVLAAERCSSFEECVAWARRRFQDYFHDRVAQLTFTFPEDAVTSTGGARGTLSLPLSSALRHCTAPLRFPVVLRPPLLQVLQQHVATGSFTF